MTGNFAHLYFAVAGFRSDVATESTITFFSCGVRSRCARLAPALAPAVPPTAALSCGAVVAQPESARIAANAANTLNFDACTIDPSLLGGCGCSVNRTDRYRRAMRRRCRRRHGRAIRANGVDAAIDHRPPVARRATHFLDVIADEFIRRLRMPGIDLAKIGHKNLRIDQARRRHFK